MPAASPLASRLRALTLYRVLFVTLLLGSSVFFDVRGGAYSSPKALSALITGLYGFTILYGLLHRKMGDRPSFALFQLTVDIAAETILVVITGGVETWFSFTYLVTILSATVILNGRAGFITASLASLSYGTIAALQANAVILPLMNSHLDPSGFLNNAFIHVVAFFSMAFLGSRLTNRLISVTEDLKRKDVDLSDLQAFSRDVVEYIPVGLATTDVSGRITMSNPAAETLCGADTSDMIGRSLSDYFPFVDISAGDEQRLEGTPRQNEGLPRTIDLLLSPLKNRRGERVGYIAIFQDLTEVKAMEKEIQKRKQLAAVGELSASIAHELRNPLASLKGSMEMLREERTAGDYSARLMDIAIREMDRLNGIISDFLLYARPKPPSGRMFDLHALLNDIVILFDHRKDIRILTQMENQMVIFGDPDQLKQVFLNLITNAVDAMKQGGVLTLAASQNQIGVCVDVRDSGDGIPEEYLERIFHPYFSTKHGGTGLGLAISYRIVEAHGGSIRAFNSAGGGSVFSIILPRSSIGEALHAKAPNTGEISGNLTEAVSHHA